MYAAMGGSGDALDAALVYSNWVFAGAVLVWLLNSLAAVIRGTGNMALPAVVTCAGVVILVPLSPAPTAQPANRLTLSRRTMGRGRALESPLTLS
jgi:hypothetical protein